MSFSNDKSGPRKNKKSTNVASHGSKQTSKRSTTNNLKKKKTKAEIIEQTDDVPMSKPEQFNIEQLISQTFLRYKAEQQLDAGIKHKEIRHLALMCEEYLSTFTLIGYSLDNEKIVVFSTPTAKDEAALVDLLRATFIDIANNRS